MANVTLPAAGEKVYGVKNGSDEFNQGFILVRTDTLEPLTIEAGGVPVAVMAIEAGDNNIGNVDVVTVPADPFGANADAASATGSISAKLRELAANGILLKAGSSLIGNVRIADGSTLASVINTAALDGLAVGLIDSVGSQIAFAAPAELAVTPTLSTSAHAAGDVLANLSFTNAAVASGGSGHILKLTVISDDDLATDMVVHFFDSDPSGASANAAHSLTDANAAKYIGSIDTEGAFWADHVNNRTCAVVPSPPIPYKLATGTTLYAIAVTKGTPTYTASGLDFKLHILKD